MVKKTKPVCIVVFLLLSLFSATALAHHLWVIPSGQEYAVARGLIPDRIDSYDPKYVVLVEAYDLSGRTMPVKRTDHPQQAHFSAGNAPAMAVVTCEWGGRVNTPDGKKLISKQQALAQGLTVVSAFESVQYAKSVFDHRIEWTHPLGLTFEIIALKNPKDVATGEPLAVQVLFEGMPLAGCPVGTGKKRGAAKTDENGIARIRLEEEGAQLLMARHNVPVEGRQDIDFRQFMTFLTFTRP